MSETLTEVVCVAPIMRGPQKGLTATGTDAGYVRHRAAGEMTCRPCKDGVVARSRRWYAANPEKAAATNRRWYEANREKKAASTRRWREANREKKAASYRRWYEANPEKKAVTNRLRDARKHDALTIAFTQDQLDARMSMFGHRCWMCGGPFEHVDHVIALARGGPHILANLRPACRPCNVSKGPKDWRVLTNLEPNWGPT